MWCQKSNGQVPFINIWCFDFGFWILDFGGWDLKFLNLESVLWIFFVHIHISRWNIFSVLWYCLWLRSCGLGSAIPSKRYGFKKSRLQGRGSEPNLTRVSLVTTPKKDITQHEWFFKYVVNILRAISTRNQESNMYLCLVYPGTNRRATYPCWKVGRQCHFSVVAELFVPWFFSKINPMMTMTHLRSHKGCSFMEAS